jgi:hypothetical protein
MRPRMPSPTERTVPHRLALILGAAPSLLVLRSHPPRTLSRMRRHAVPRRAHRAPLAHLAPRRHAFFSCPPQPPPADTQQHEEDGKWRPRMPQRRQRTVLRRPTLLPGTAYSSSVLRGRPPRALSCRRSMAGGGRACCTAPCSGGAPPRSAHLAAAQATAISLCPPSRADQALRSPTCPGRKPPFFGC